jgi:hypothetical protein
MGGGGTEEGRRRIALSGGQSGGPRWSKSCQSGGQSRVKAVSWARASPGLLDFDHCGRLHSSVPCSPFRSLSPRAARPALRGGRPSSRGPPPRGAGARPAPRPAGAWGAWGATAGGGASRSAGGACGARPAPFAGRGPFAGVPCHGREPPVRRGKAGRAAWLSLEATHRARRWREPLGCRGKGGARRVRRPSDFRGKSENRPLCCPPRTFGVPVRCVHAQRRRGSRHHKAMASICPSSPRGSRGPVGRAGRGRTRRARRAGALDQQGWAPAQRPLPP